MTMPKGYVIKTIYKVKLLFKKRKAKDVPSEYEYYYGYEEDGRFYRPEHRFLP